MGEQERQKTRETGSNQGGPLGITRNLAFTPSETDLCLVALLAARTGETSSLRQASVFSFEKQK